ncbi:MAG: ATP-binding protein [Longimicrobiales bacterium]
MRTPSHCPLLLMDLACEVHPCSSMDPATGDGRKRGVEKSRWDLPNPDRSDLGRARNAGDADEQERNRRAPERAADAHEGETESALRESEERFRFLFEDNPTMYFIVDEAGTIQSVNRYGAEYLGYTVAELVGQSVLTVILPSDRKIVRQHLAQCLRTPGQVCHWEFRKVKKDGSVLWVRELARPMREAGSDKISVLIVCEDITDTKRAAETQRFLSEASSLLASSLDYERTLKAVTRLAVPAVADWCVINLVDAEGKMERVYVAHRDPEKEARARAARRPGSEMATDIVSEVIRTGKSVLERDISKEALVRLTGDEQLFQLAIELGTRSGIAVPLRARGRVLGAITLVASDRNYDASDLALATSLADRAALAVDNARLYRESERRAGEERALREAVAEVGAAGTTDEVIREIARTAAVATSADSAFVTRLREGRDDVEIVGVSGVLPPADAQVTVSDAHYTRQVIEHREPLLVPRLREAEGPLRSGALARAWPEGSALVIPLIGGEQPIGALVLIRAPRKPVFTPDEVKHARTFGELAALAFRRIQLLEESETRRKELERVTESRARLMRGFSHDLKNPLGAADGHAQILAEGVLGELSQQQLESVQRIRRSIHNSLGLIQELLELARAESGQITVAVAPTDVAAVARDAAQDFRAQATEAGIALVVNAPGTLLIETDSRRVRQILHNLLSNCVKHGARGTVTVTVERKARGPAARPGEWVALSVTDTGPGIPAEKHELVFQEFTRLDPNAPQGTGLGLAISRRIARLLGGDITLSSEPGRGSTFTLWLP